VLVGLSEFESYYENLLGADRWARLRATLLLKEQKHARPNGFAPHGDVQLTYLMDYASLFPALSLSPQPGDRVVDLCAAPGGKTLILAEALQGDGKLIANEISQPRRDRLKAVLRQYIPDHLRANLTVTGKPGEKWGVLFPESAERILLDAPCSGERHLLHTPKEMKQWSASRVKRHVQRQLALACAAVDALVPGGRLVYSTCSINSHENDGLIEKLLEKREHVRVVPMNEVWSSIPLSRIGEPTQYGWQIWPDQTEWGPIYWAVITRLGVQ
jgi:16S rRNA C967 or C1407 C5-methylase (RsmB/RsmF family)